MMRPRELFEFRTPQHPSLGTNNWGGPSPLLARNVPKESLEQRFLRLNNIRTRDEIFPPGAEEFLYLPTIQDSKDEPAAPKPSRRGILWKLMNLRIRKKKENEATLGSNSDPNSDSSSKKKKKRWLPTLNPKNRWPQGWC